MTVSVELTGGGYIVAWQTSDGISFQEFDADLQPVGAPTVAETGTAAWLSATALSDGGFSIIWDTSAPALPIAQDYDASGTAAGAAHTLTTPPPSASIAFASQTTDPDGSGPWTAPLANGDSVTVTDSNGSSGPSLTMQQYDPSGNPVGPAYVHSIQGLPGLGHVEIASLANGNYAVSFVDESNYGAQSFVDLFDPLGNHLAGDPVASAGYELIPAQAIAGLADGGFAVSWVAAEYNTNPGTSSPYAVFSQEYNAAGSAVGAQQMLAVLPGNTTTAPEIDAFANGQYVISWTANGAAQSASFTEQGTAITPDTNDTIATPAIDYTLPVGLHDVALIGDYAQTVTGNDLGDTLTSNDYASTLIGGTGNDTLIAGHDADVLIGGGGDDTFVFDALPWNPGHITDFNTASDTLDLSGIFASIGYTGSNPVADGYLTFASDGSGNTQVYVDTHQPSDPWPNLVTMLDGVAPSSITPADYGYDSSGSDIGSGGGGSGDSGPGSGSGGSTVDDSQPSYTAPDGVTNIVLTGSAAQTVTANNAGDTITSNDYGSTIIGGSGNDTLIAGHDADMLTGGGGNDSFVFNYLPWDAGHITDFNPNTDMLDLSGIFGSIGYTGSNPVADGYLSFVDDGNGNTEVIVNPHNGDDPWGALVTTLDHVVASSITAQDYVFNSTSGGGGMGGTGGTGGGSGSGGGATVDDSQPTYTVPDGVTNVVLTGTAAQTVTANNAGDTVTSNDYGSTLIGGSGNDTLIAGHEANIFTGNGGDDSFVFNYLPWNAGQITDFNTANDVLNLKGIFAAIGYTGSNPVGEGYLTFTDDGHGDTQVYVDTHSASDPWPNLVTTLDHVSPSAMHAGDYLFA
ncbi:MAG TPA: type I secretion C-terminal target domain-containing protein [Stellaceae bacterium]|jgi:Ca2+-binding RTX toxin-like protein